MPTFIFCEICHRHHWSHYHQRAEVLFAIEDPNTGDVEIMANELDVDGSVDTTFYGALGALTDSNGNTVEDVVASATWSVDNTDVANVTPNPNNAVDAVFTVTGNGTANVSVTGDTAAGSTVNGTGSVTVTNFTAVGTPAVNVAVELSLTDPDASTTTPTSTTGTADTGSTTSTTVPTVTDVTTTTPDNPLIPPAS